MQLQRVLVCPASEAAAETVRRWQIRRSTCSRRREAAAAEAPALEPEACVCNACDVKHASATLATHDTHGPALAPEMDLLRDRGGEVKDGGRKDEGEGAMTARKERIYNQIDEVTSDCLLEGGANPR